MQVSIIIPNYNGSALLKKNIPKVILASKNAEIIVVDDCSTDNSLEVLKQFDVKVIINKKNLGFSSTVNRGVQEAKNEIVVLLNTDVMPEKSFLDPLLEHFSDPDVFAAGCLEKSIENGKTILRGRGIGKWRRGFLEHARGEVDKTNTLWVNGGSGAFRKSIWIKLGGLDALYNPFYYEDIDISYRALKLGYKIFFESQSAVIHEHESGSIKTTFSPVQIKTIAYRNQFLFVWRDITDLQFLLQHILWLPYHLLRGFITLDKSFIRGFLAACIKLPRVLFQKLSQKDNFVKTDKEVFHEFKVDF